MEKMKIRHYTIDGDTITVSQVYDDELGIYRNDYPDFDQNPRVTPSGKRWTNVYKEDCPHATSECGDCGSCDYFKSEKEGDLIGVCENEKLKLQPAECEAEQGRKEA